MAIIKVDKSYLVLLNIYDFLPIRTKSFPKYESTFHISLHY